MAGGGEYEPKDSRRVVGTRGDKDKSWREQEDPRKGRGAFEPPEERDRTEDEAEDRASARKARGATGAN